MSQSLNENQASNGPPPQDSQPASALDIAQSLMALSTSLRHSLPSQSEWADPTWNADKLQSPFCLTKSWQRYLCSIFSSAQIRILPSGREEFFSVCRKWRSVALDHAKLWCWISSDSTRRMYRWEKRSKKHPLHCKLDATHPVIFLRNSERIRSLQVSGADPELRDFFQGNITNLPILETLIIQSFGGDLHDDGDSVDTWHVPSWIVDGGAPRLRSLKLDSAFFSTGKMNLLENLLHLSLEQEAVPSGSHCLPHFEDLAAVLRRSPRLQTLNIQHYIETQTIWQQRSLFAASIHLPELHHLEVNADIVVATALLNSIVMPSYTTVLLKGHRHLIDGYFSDLSDLMVPVRRHLQQTEFRSINLDRPF
ncbi:hypothetical protein BT96DRAFT_1023018 [Gymnopus androsaceus JB14]|uniref:F-box domain-containing protein n=1 Tax=Gymnopus androsaceus JB14 TaxID=1447944 RepID=A0A6A4H6X0_9AGAR|nr:hypothetical protein BT96DRAFT_1023018 [Gymnopus androsaceus JB14]